MAYQVIDEKYLEYHCFCILSYNHHVKDTGPMKTFHYAVLRRPMNDQAHPCYCGKRKDHDLTPRTPVVNALGISWGGFESNGKVHITSEGFMKVVPMPNVMDKHAAPIFAALRDKFNKRIRERNYAMNSEPF